MTQLFATPPESYRMERSRLLANMKTMRAVVRQYGAHWTEGLKGRQRDAAKLRRNWQSEIVGWVAK